MDHGKARGPRGGKAAPEPIDVGDDPPLFVDGEPGDIIDRRYKILRIAPNSVDIEDLLEKTEHRLTLR